MLKKITLIFVLEIFLNFNVVELDSAKGETVSVVKLVDINDHRKKTILRCFFEVESANGTLLYNQQENAVGWLQIRPIMVREVNLLLGYKKYNLQDRWDKNRSIEMFWIYQYRFNPELDVEKAARLWNGGRSGMQKHSTIPYANKIKQKFNQYYLNIYDLYNSRIVSVGSNI